MVEDRAHLLKNVCERAVNYCDALESRSVLPSKSQLDALKRFAEPMPDSSSSAEAVLALLDEVGSPATVATAGPRFFGFVNGGTLPVALAANWLAGAWDQDAGMYATSPVAATLELVVMEWLIDLFGLPRESAASFVTGATMANFTALAAARSHVLKMAGWDVDNDGLFGASAITVVVSEATHASIFKALAMLGLGRQRVVRVPCDEHGRIDVEQIPAIDPPAIVCTQVGQVNSGASDQVADICRRLRRDAVWIHVDGAFGLWAAACGSTAHLVRGVEAADSWAVDAHKWLNVSYDSGIAFVRHGDALRSAMAATADYLIASDNREPDQHTPEMSRRARAVEIWAVLKTLGREGVSNLIERCCRYARMFAEQLQAAGFAVLNDVQLNQVVVALENDELSATLIDAVQAGGICYCSKTVWRGRVAMRISVTCWATTEQDVARSVAAIVAAARLARGEHP